MKKNVFNRAKDNVLSVIASLAFFLGSVLFLPSFAEHATMGVWLFMTGSALMFFETIKPNEE